MSQLLKALVVLALLCASAALERRILRLNRGLNEAAIAARAARSLSWPPV